MKMFVKLTDADIYTAAPSDAAPKIPKARRIAADVGAWVLSRHTAVGIMIAYAASDQLLQIVVSALAPVVLSPKSFVVLSSRAEAPLTISAAATALVVVAIVVFRKISSASGPTVAFGAAVLAYLGWMLAVALVYGESVISEANPSVALSLVPAAIIAAIYDYGERRKLHAGHVAVGHSSTADLPSLIAGLRGRATLLRRQAAIVLVAVAVGIGFGIWIFVRAESFGQMSAIDGRMEDLTRAINSRHDLNYIEALNSGKLGKDVKSGMVTDLKASLQALNSSTDALVEEMRTIKDSPAFQPDSRFEIFLISTLSTRIGIILLLIFFIQILVSLYRYSMRLAGVYDMHADALIAKCQLPPETQLEQLTAFFANQMVDFSATPKAPSEMLHQTLKDTLDAIRKEPPGKK